MAKRQTDRYEVDPHDGFDREIVGAWAADKHLRLERYVDITSATRRKWTEEWGKRAAYVDLYCGPGRSRQDGTNNVEPGSAVLAAQKAMEKSAFAEVHIADLRAENVTACEARLKAAGVASVFSYVGRAAETVDRIVASLDKKALHLFFLDPYSVHALPFSVIRSISRLERADMLIHFSKMDFQRNVVEMSRNGRLDEAMPNWQKSCDLSKMGLEQFKAAAFRHWRNLIGELGYNVSDRIVTVTGPNNSDLYWLVLASRSELADKFWCSVSHAGPQAAFPF